MAHLATLFSFCLQIHRISIPTMENTLLLYVAHLAKSGLAYATIKVYLSAIRQQHLEVGKSGVFTDQLTPCLHEVLHGIKKEQSRTRPPRVRLTITIDIMQDIRHQLDKDPANEHNIMLWAVCCIASFGLVRCSKVTVASQQEYNPEVHLSF